MARAAAISPGKLLPIAVCLLLAAPALGVVGHPGAGQPTDRPNDDVIGLWGSGGATNASCVAIGDDWVVTTQHQGVNIGYEATLGGTMYVVGDIYKHPTADLTLAWLKKDGQYADLQHYVELYDGRSEANELTVIGGYGRTTGATLYTGGGTAYGYEWAPSPTSAPVWGSNKIESIRRSDVIMEADFDESDTAYEATIADKDSGNGWFIKNSGQWQLAGLGYGITAHYEPGHEDDPNYRLEESWFRDSSTGNLAPDLLYAIRMKSYSSWVDNIVNNWKLPGDANEDGKVTDADYTIWANNFDPATGGATWAMGDFDGNGYVDDDDYDIWERTYGYGVVPAPPPPSTPVPEPASTAVLAIGVIALIARRARRS